MGWTNSVAYLRITTCDGFGPVSVTCLRVVHQQRILSEAEHVAKTFVNVSGIDVQLMYDPGLVPGLPVQWRWQRRIQNRRETDMY
jgi:hypothetical protein